MSFELVEFKQETKNRVVVKAVSAKNGTGKFLLAKSEERK